MKIETLLRTVPSLDEWAQADVDVSALRLHDVFELERAYYDAFRVELAAADEDGRPAVLPDEHILDALVRDWVHEDELPRRMDFGTVVIAPELPPCDLCGWGAARYESRVGQGGALANLCLCCLVRRGDRMLGHGRATLLLLEEEVPDRLVAQLHRVLPQAVLIRWTDRYKDGWDAFRRWGFFTSRDDPHRMYAFILGLQLSLEFGPLGSVKVVAQRPGIRHVYEPGGDTHLVPRVDDALDARAVLIRVLRTEVTTGRANAECDRHFHVDPSERDTRALAALRLDGGSRWLSLGDILYCDTGDYQMLEAAAESSSDPRTVAEMALTCREGHIRRTAALNPCLPPVVLAELASRRDPAVIGALLERPDLPEQATRQVIETLLLAGELDQFHIYAALQRSDFPDDLLDTVLKRISARGTRHRIALARTAWDGVPAHRRDHIHLALLRKARRVKSTEELFEAVVGDDPTRAAWLRERNDWKIRDLLTWRDEVKHSAAKSVSRDAGTQETDPVPEPPKPDRFVPDMKLSGSAISARLRRWWLTEAAVDLDLLASDLGNALLECRLVRVGPTLHVLMPYDFGVGSPVSPPLAQRLTGRVSDVTAGAIRALAWSFHRRSTPSTRKRSSDLDIYQPGDPPFEQWASLAHDLAHRIERDAEHPARTALQDVRLAGVSRHRLWLALPNVESVHAIGTTPGAAATLKIAVARVQRKKPEDALYSIVADPDPGSPRLPVT